MVFPQIILACTHLLIKERSHTSFFLATLKKSKAFFIVFSNLLLCCNMSTCTFTNGKLWFAIFYLRPYAFWLLEKNVPYIWLVKVKKIFPVTSQPLQKISKKQQGNTVTASLLKSQRETFEGIILCMSNSSKCCITPPRTWVRVLLVFSFEVLFLSWR